MAPSGGLAVVGGSPTAVAQASAATPTPPPSRRSGPAPSTGVGPGGCRRRPAGNGPPTGADKGWSCGDPLRNPAGCRHPRRRSDLVVWGDKRRHFGDHGSPRALTTPSHPVVTVPRVDAIVCVGLDQTLGDTVAVDGLDLAVPRGMVYGFLGQNGAGKTTTLRMLLGLVRPSAGQAAIMGQARQGRTPMTTVTRLSPRADRYRYGPPKGAGQ
jgi:ABC-type glutathione transport system ATPase component